MKKKAEFLSRGGFIWGCRLGCDLLQKAIFLLVMVFFVKDALCQNQLANPKKDSKTDSLRPKVDFVGAISKPPFYNYLKEEMQKVVKVEEERLAAAPNLNIQGLIWGGRFPLAIIESRVLKAGDVISGYTIDKIDKNGVVLSVKGTLFKVCPPSLTQVNNAAKNQEGDKDAK